jgi:hypothetical protein
MQHYIRPFGLMLALAVLIIAGGRAAGDASDSASAKAVFYVQ